MGGKAKYCSCRGPIDCVSNGRALSGKLKCKLSATVHSNSKLRQAIEVKIEAERDK